MNVESNKSLMEKWLLHTARKAHAHASCAHKSRVWRFLIGVPSVILAAIVGTAVFSEIHETGLFGDALHIYSLRNKIDPIER